MNTVNTVNNISLVGVLKLALRYIHILIAVALVSSVLAFSYCHFIASPRYSSTGSIVVTNGAIINATEVQTSATTTAKKVSSSDISASLQLSNTIIDILNTNDIYKQLASDLGDKYTYSDLMSRATVKRRNEDTLFIDANFTAATPEEAQTLVNNFLKLVPDYILKFIPNSTAAVTNTADKAVMIYPQTSKTTFIAAVSGALLCFAVIYLLHIFNTTIKNEDDVKTNYNLTVLGSIPDFSSANLDKKHKYYSYSKGGGSANGKQ